MSYPRHLGQVVTGTATGKAYQRRGFEGFLRPDWTWMNADPRKSIRLNFGFCVRCGLTGSGHGYFMETTIENNPFGYFCALPGNPDDKVVSLRLVNRDGRLTGYYTTTPGDGRRLWQSLPLCQRGHRGHQLAVRKDGCRGHGSAV